MAKEVTFKYELGKKAKDKVTGFKGIITGQAKHLTGCDTYGLTSTVNKDGNYHNNWFDEGRILIIEGGIDPDEVQRTHDNKSGPCGDPMATNVVG